MTRVRIAALAGLAALAVALCAAAAPSTSRAAAATCRGTAAVIDGKLTCLRERARCQRKLDRTYARYGFRCRKPKRRGAATRLTLGDPVKRRGGEPYAIRHDGTVDKTTALQLFSSTFGPLPGVKVPKGAVGRVYDGTDALRQYQRYRRSLPARQRRAADKLLARAEVGPAGFDPGPAKSELDKAVGEIELHTGDKLGKATKLVASPTTPKDGALAVADGAGSTCTITLFKPGQDAAPAALRGILVHEAFHCFQYKWNPTGYTKLTHWLWEGSATWAEAVIDDERGDSDPVVDDWWEDWLTSPGTQLFSRSYGAIGFFSHMQRTGGNPWESVPRMVKAASNADAYEIATGGASGEKLVDTWGSGYFRRPELGASWDFQGPLIPADKRPSIDSDRIRNGDDATVAAWGWSATQRILDVDTEVVTVDSDTGARGRIADVFFREYPLASGEFCAKPDGCRCPDGSAGPPRLLVERAVVGVAGHNASGGARFRGQSLEDWCAAKPSNIGVSGAVGGTVTSLGTCGVDSTGTFIAVFELDGSPRHLLQVDTDRYAGVGTYPTRSSSFAGRTTLGDGLGRSWESDRTGEGGGSFSITAETATQFRGSVASNMTSADGSSVAASGPWTCDKR